MPQYAIIGHHPPDNCPISNKAVRAFAQKNFAKLPTLAKKKGVKILAALHLDPNHKGFIWFEAPSAEAVRDLLVEGGMMHYIEMEFHLVSPLEDLIKNADKFPTIY